jgi:hypothetical protein
VTSVLVVHGFENAVRPATGSTGRPLGLDVDGEPGGGHLDVAAGYEPWPSVLRWCADPAVRLKRV